MKKLPDGIYSVLLTPLTESGGVDEKGLASMANRLIEDGVRGLVVIGSMGELPYLSEEEKKRAMDAVTEAARGRAAVICGAGGFSTDEAIRTVKYAEKQHADALLIPLPIYFSLKFENVFNHYRRIADSTSLPILYYHFPEVTHLDLKTSELVKLFEIENMAGIKDSIFDMRTIRSHIKNLPGGASVFAGTSLLLRPTVRAGGAGCICPIPDIIPQTCVEFYDALKGNKRAAVEKLEKEVFKIASIFSDAPLPPEAMRAVIRTGSELGLPLKMGGSAHAAFKEALRLCGHPITARVKSPLPELDDKSAKKIHRLMKEIKLVKEGIK